MDIQSLLHEQYLRDPLVLSVILHQQPGQFTQYYLLL